MELRAGTDWKRTTAIADLIDPITSWIEEVVVDPENERRLLVRFWNGDSLAYGARLQVVESVGAVAVQLVTGFVPGTAAAGRDAMASGYELAAELERPLGRRLLIIGSPTACLDHAS